MEIIKRYDPAKSLILGDVIDNDPPIFEDINEYRIPNAYIGYYGYITKNFKNIEEIVSPRHRGSIPFTSVLSNHLIKKKVRVNKPAISIVNGWYDNFYHFSLECMQKLYILKDCLPEATLVLPYKLSKFHKEWIEIVGVNDITYIYEDEVIETPLAITCNFPNRDLNHHDVILCEFRDWIMNKLDLKHNSSTAVNKIIIGRPQGSKRNLINIEELKNKITPLGYQYYELEDMSLIEQIKLFTSASHIVAVHGAALSHLMFCHPKTFVLDLIHENYNVYCFFKISKILDLSYQMIKCEGNKNETDRFGYRDFSVSIKKIENYVHN